MQFLRLAPQGQLRKIHPPRMKSSNKEIKISYWAAHLTSIVSVTLVLLIIGVIALLSISAATETRRLREQVELSAVMEDSADAAAANAVLAYVTGRPYCKSARVVSKEEALKAWSEATGENLSELYEVNPLSPEVSFKLRAQYATPEHIRRIRAEVGRRPGVEGVAAPDGGIVESMNRNVESLTIVLGSVAAALLIISFVLINNTVRLTIYSRRFSIHTMQLVGATNGFIRRPFIMNNLLCGLIAGALATGLLAAALYGAQGAGALEIATFIPVEAGIAVGAGLIGVGAVICAVAALLATGKYLRKDYDELFR